VTSLHCLALDARTPRTQPCMLVLNSSSWANSTMDLEQHPPETPTTHEPIDRLPRNKRTKHDLPRNLGVSCNPELPIEQHHWSRLCAPNIVKRYTGEPVNGNRQALGGATIAARRASPHGSYASTNFLSLRSHHKSQSIFGLLALIVLRWLDII
jgi:hypothetical protein